MRSARRSAVTAARCRRVRADDLGAVPLRALMQRNPGVDWGAVDDVVYGCANQAGEDNRNVGAHGAAARRAAAGRARHDRQPAVRLEHGRDRASPRARSRRGETSLMLAGGVESMSRAPFVQGKATEAFSRAAKIEDTTIGWRFVNPLMKSQLRRRLDARDGGERRAGVQREPRRPGRVRAAQPAARRRRDCRGPPGGGDRSGRRSRRKRAIRSSVERRTSIRARPRSRRWPSSRASCGRTAR